MSWIHYNPNPEQRRVGDCVIRAISKATGMSWRDVYSGVCAQGYELFDMPSSNAVWGSWLKRNGFVRRLIPDDYPDNFTVEDFCREYPVGLYILVITGHVVCVIDGDWYDSLDSGRELVEYYWTTK